MPKRKLNINEKELTHEEIKMAIKKLKNGKASGIDSIPTETLKIGEENTTQMMHDLINKIWNEETIPTEWKESHKTP